MYEKRDKATIRFHSASAQYSEFDNSAPYAIRIGDVTWPTVTHYLLVEQYPGQNIDRIRLARSVEEAIEAAPGEHAIERNKWDVVRDDYLVRALKAKFSQHLDLEQMLYGTGHANLVYDCEDDAYLGTGSSGTGHNMLGRLLMAVRGQMGHPKLSHNLSKQVLQDLAEYETRARANPDNADKLSDLAGSYFSLGWYDRAIGAARLSLRADPTHTWGYLILAQSFIQVRRFEKAVAPLKQLIRLESDDSDHYRLLSLVYREIGKRIPAILYNRRAKLLDAEE